MTHPLRDLAQKLERRNRLTRQRSTLDAALTSRHLARDIGLEHRIRRHHLTDF
ncbi:MAG: hypothetical protein KJO42_01975 [Silicimonas sp.]|nr:hypothetical protein [Silicimonas sp.]MBT8425732.1 hypothetical protein [Silicimonas sp.]NNF90656.1 hypothetical protein [Boseongicola sp.]NNL34358.1 hypothetical protein [Silicimonas sp.]